MLKLLQPASAEERSQADELVNCLLAQVPYAVGAAVIDAITGLPLAHGGAPGEQNPVSYAMQFGRIARCTAALAAAVGPDERVEELVLPCGPCNHVLRLAPSGKHWVYLAVNTHDLNVGIIRELLRELTHEGPVTAG
ncbi:MAG: hypothetical protein H7330_05995 [Hymenobacteraceae bacterium]|nr:hypothetical protein [Hymenobacteraceae bacterium]